MFYGAKKKIESGWIKQNKKTIIIISMIIIAIIASIIGVNKFLDRKTELTLTEKGHTETAEKAEYKIKTERRSKNIFINNKSQILAQTVVDTPTISGRKDLNTNVQKWASGFERNAGDFIDSYKDTDADEFIKENAAFDTKIQGKEYPLFSYYKAEICTKVDKCKLAFEPRKDNKILSIVYHEEGAPYCSEISSKFKTAVFDVKTGEKLSLELLMNDYNVFCDIAGRYVISKLREKEEYEIVYYYQETAPKKWMGKEMEWYLSKNGIVLFCTSGMPNDEVGIEVPYEYIGKFIKTEYIPDELEKTISENDVYETEIDEVALDGNKARYTTRVKKNGEVIWSYNGPIVDMSQCAQMCAMVGNYHIYIADQSTLMKFEKGTKTLIWKRNFEGYSFGHMTCDPSDNIYAISSLGGHILKISPEGKLLWQSEVDGSDAKTFCLLNNNTQLKIVFYIPPDTQYMINADTGKEM